MLRQQFQHVEHVSVPEEERSDLVWEEIEVALLVEALHEASLPLLQSVVLAFARADVVLVEGLQ